MRNMRKSAIFSAAAMVVKACSFHAARSGGREPSCRPISGRPVRTYPLAQMLAGTGMLLMLLLLPMARRQPMSVGSSPVAASLQMRQIHFRF